MPSGVKYEEDRGMEVRKADEVGSKMESSADSKHAREDAPIVKKSPSKDKDESAANRMESNEESVEVVLGEEGMTKVVEEESPKKSKNTPDQNVFRQPETVRPKAMRAPNGASTQHLPPPPPPPPYPHHHQQHHHHPHPYYPYPHTSGSWGYGPPPPPPPHGEYLHPPPPRAPYPVPPYSASGSFEDPGVYHHHTPHYSPHIQYPPPGGRYPSEDVNVISPNHKVNSPHRPPPPSTPSRRHLTPPQHYYQYPPTSPVSRPGGHSSGAPRLRNYAMRRGEGAYTKAQQGDKSHRPEEGGWGMYGGPPPPVSSRDPKGRHQTPLVADSFDSGHMSRTPHPPTPGGHPQPPPTHSDPHYHFYGGGGSWGSFDSAMGPPPPPHIEDQRYYSTYPPESPYSAYAPPYSPGPLYRADSFPSPGGYGPPLPPAFSYSFDDENTRLLQDYNPDHDGDSMHKQVTPPGNSKKSGRSKSGTPIASNTSDRNALLPKAAEEIDFDVACPPMEPITPECDDPICESLAEVNSFDVLCGRGGGTNSQVGNRRFRQLVQEFQPIYLLAKRKEKPLLARTIVLIIRKRGGRFLKKNEETGQLFEVGDTKAEAKTSQALREGLDVRATKSAQSLMDKQKKKKKGSPKSPGSETTYDSPMSTQKSTASSKDRPTESPPTLPRLQGEEVKVGEVHPHSPDQNQLRKRRRVRSADRFFNDFCPPRADINQAGCNPMDCGGMEDDDDDSLLHDVNSTPVRRNHSMRDDEYEVQRGCAGIALDIVTGAAKASFCLGPTGWRR